MKHAFLIIAHNNPRIFETLIGLLDFKDNDIFVHIDKKADINDFTKAKCSFSNIVFVENRLDVRWGDFSQILCEMELFRSAHSYCHYEYYHLLSGVDLPIKSNEYIHNFF